MGGAVRCVARGTRADRDDLVRARPRNFGLEHRGIRAAGLRALANGGGRNIPPSPFTHHEAGDLTQSVRKGGVSPFLTINYQSMFFDNNIVGALLAFRRQVAICEVVAGQALMVVNPGAVENSKREAWKSLTM